jgi:hypothetical protein
MDDPAKPAENLPRFGKLSARQQRPLCRRQEQVPAVRGRLPYYCRPAKRAFGNQMPHEHSQALCIFSEKLEVHGHAPEARRSYANEREYPCERQPRVGELPASSELCDVGFS